MSDQEVKETRLRAEQLMERLNSVDERLKTLREKMTATEEALTRERKEGKAAVEAKETALRDLERLKPQVDELTEKADALEEENARFLEERQGFNATIDQLKAEAAKLRVSLLEKEKEIEQLNRDLSSSDAEAEGYAKQAIDLEAEVKRLQAVESFSGALQEWVQKAAETYLKTALTQHLNEVRSTMAGLGGSLSTSLSSELRSYLKVELEAITADLRKEVLSIGGDVKVERKLGDFTYVVKHEPLTLTMDSARGRVLSLILKGDLDGPKTVDFTLKQLQNSFPGVGDTESSTREALNYYVLQEILSTRTLSSKARVYQIRADQRQRLHKITEIPLPEPEGA